MSFAKSVKYRLTQSSKFDLEKTYIEPNSWKDTALFIVDSGIDDVECVDFFKGADIEGYRDSVGHGTEMATLAKETNPATTIYNVKVTTDGHSLTIEDAVAAFQKIKEFKESNDIPVIISCSWHCDATEELESAIKDCLELDDLYIFAATGNTICFDKKLPGALPDVYTVGGLDINLKPPQTQHAGADLFVSSTAVQCGDKVLQGSSSIANVMASAAMTMLPSFTDNNCAEVFENMINDKTKQLVWPFTLIEGGENATFNIAAMPSIDELQSYNSANIIGEVLWESPMISISDKFTKLFVNTNHHINTTSSFEEGETGTFTIKYKFKNFEFLSQELDYVYASAEAETRYVTMSLQGFGKFHCFVAGSRVLLSDGTTKPIEYVQENDMVVSSNNLSGIVTKVTKHGPAPKQIHNINNGVLETTSCHPILTTDGWKAISPARARELHPEMEIGSLRVGDEMVTLDSTIKIENIYTDIRIDPIYNISVTGSDNTYVVNGIIVHNK